MTIRFFEHYKRSLTKAVTFRIIALCADFLVINALTQKSEVALGIIILTNSSSTILYFLHERVWNRIHWGKNK